MFWFSDDVEAQDGPIMFLDRVDVEFDDQHNIGRSKMDFIFLQTKYCKTKMSLKVKISNPPIPILILRL